ncbi:MAG: hypothetical protein KDI36_09755 [Pseudomonadales bacterium]|nr:hypothetical protein [Pseudomonadales bacterium]
MSEASQQPMGQRFYPDTIPPFEYEPTRDRFSIPADPRFGEGVVSLVPFSKGDIVFAFTGFFSAQVTQFSLQVRKDLHLHDPYFYGKILHSCQPNTRVYPGKRQFIAVRSIEPGQYVTMDYAQTEDFLFRTFECGCGSRRCRGFVTGKKQRNPAAKQPILHPGYIPLPAVIGESMRTG